MRAAAAVSSSGTTAIGCGDCHDAGTSGTVDAGKTMDQGAYPPTSNEHTAHLASGTFVADPDCDKCHGAGAAAGTQTGHKNGTVANIVRMTSRFAYVTTRFHPNPASLLDFTTQFDVDPTHITLLNKDMLRLMFVLEGCRSRPDLEARMDWGNKGRVLVLEKLAG